MMKLLQIMIQIAKVRTMELQIYLIDKEYNLVHDEEIDVVSCCRWWSTLYSACLVSWYSLL